MDKKIKPRRLLSKADTAKYAGKYVCTKNFKSKKVISASTNPASALKQAEENGYLDPVVFFVPNMKQIFLHQTAH